MTVLGGKVYFVGGGPGSRGLVTVRGAEILAAAHVVAHAADVPADILELCGAATRLPLVAFGRAHQEGLADHLVAVAKEGKVAVWLSAYDALGFAERATLMDLVQSRTPHVEAVPGVSPYDAIAAHTGLLAVAPQDVSPSVAFLRVRNEWVDLFPWERLAHATDALVCAVDHAALSSCVAALIAEGRSPSTPAAVVSHLALPAQAVRRGTLGDIATRARALSAPTLLLLVGDALKTDRPSWFEDRPLFGKRVLVTRARDQAPGTADLLRSRGAEPIVVPTIAIHDPVGNALPEALAALPERFDWVAFTSANGVTRTMAAVRALGRDARLFGPVRIAAIGPGTAAALEPFGLRADVVAKEFKGEGLAEAMLAAAPSGSRRVLVARAKEAREALPDLLRAAGWSVTVVPAYETKPAGPAAKAAIEPLLAAKALDAVLFTSASTVSTLVDLLGPEAARLLDGVTLASIGPITSAALQQKGLSPTVTASAYTLPGLLDALEGHYAGRSRTLR